MRHQIRNHQIDEATKHVSITKLPVLVNELTIFFSNKGIAQGFIHENDLKCKRRTMFQN